MEITRKLFAALFALSLVLVPAACSDEDGDGATTDEELDELDQEIDEGTNEADDGGE